LLTFSFHRKQISCSDLEMDSAEHVVSTNLLDILKHFIESSKMERRKAGIKSFIALHNSDDYQQQLAGLTNTLTIQKLNKTYAESLFDLELQIHRGNCQELHKCIKKHLGTSSHSKILYSLIKKESIIKRMEKRILHFLFQTKFGIVALNIFKVFLKIIFYYADIYKDVFFLTKVSIGFTEF
jgi:hypothetical protein